MSYCLNFRIGGAWGHKFFESDHDQDIVAQLGADMGICKYNPDHQMQDSLLNPHHGPFLVAHILPAELGRVFEKYYCMLQCYKVIGVEATREEGFLLDSPRYYIFGLGLLAMQLGCKLPRQHRRWINENWDACLFNEERREQAMMAVDQFKEGKSLALDSATLNDRIVALAGGEGNWVGRVGALKAPLPMLEVELAVKRMHLDNEIAKAKGGTSTRGVNISEPLASYSDLAILERTDFEMAKKMVIPESEVNMAPDSGLGHWLANEAARKRWGTCEGAVRPQRPSIICEACLRRLTALHNPAGGPLRFFSVVSRPAAATRRTLEGERAGLNTQVRIQRYSSTPAATESDPKTSAGNQKPVFSAQAPIQLGAIPGAECARLTNRRLIALSGPDAAKFLQGLITNNVDPKRTDSFYAAFLDARGRILHDVFVWTYPDLHNEKDMIGKYGAGEWACYIEVEDGEVEALFKHLKRHRLRSKVDLRVVEGNSDIAEDAPENVQVWAVWGELRDINFSYEVVARLDDLRFISNQLEMQRWLIRPVGTHIAEKTFGDLKQYIRLRYSFGVVEGAEIPKETNPHNKGSALPMEYNVDISQGIDFKKGCYVGQELTIRTKHTGVVRKRILPVELFTTDADSVPPNQTSAFDKRTLAPFTLDPSRFESSDIKELDENGKQKNGRAAGKLISMAGNLGLALCRLEMMTPMKVSAEGGSWKPDIEFGLADIDGNVVKVKPFLRDEWVARVRDLWDKNRIAPTPAIATYWDTASNAEYISAPQPPSTPSTFSKFISKFRSKQRTKPASPPLPTDTRPPLIPSPLPLVLPAHQDLLSHYGWTTITLPQPDTSDPSSPPLHPLQTAYHDLFAAAQSFFNSPDSEKQQWKHRLGSEEGWSKIPGEKEFITLRTLAYTPDVLKAPAKRYWDLMGAHLLSTLGRISTSLGLPSSPDAGLGKFVGECVRMGEQEGDKTATMLRIFRYEGWEAKVVAEPHSDLGLLSAVVGDVPGLEVWDGRAWRDIERSYSGHQATYTVGRQLERLSNGRYPAGGHRVVSYGAPESREGEEVREKRYRHSIVFVLRAHVPVVVESKELETEITGTWAEPVSGVTAGEMYADIRKRHFNINTGHEEREKQRRDIEEGKGKGVEKPRG
ncbi:hypothetical protein BU23DRAFT_572787 [Bimuria novae-zelandiae CBS 107.79]|uniref:Iron-sulfur cluster assembly factor IBA57 homolog, mitochondrial n=1 Tax=Bimuria novae-zelandiae CBS 107.79 TaxID=1447943 RepID=A0A6A5UUB1_9PLEO|nr:hypothetical protein BU23DRAFT_572787 [Bimuria novae-zelandiae CBS 107.79]